MNTWLKSLLAGLVIAGLVFLFYQNIIPQKNRSRYKVHFIAKVTAFKNSTGKNQDAIINSIPLIIRRRAEAADYIAMMKIIDNKTLDITIQHVDDIPLVRKMITYNNQLEFRELYRLDEISQIAAIGNEVTAKYLPPSLPKKTVAQKPIDSSISPEVRKLLADMEKREQVTERDASGLGALILFHPAGSGFSYSSIGSVKVKDTAVVNKILRDPELSQSLPQDIKFYYGPDGDYNQKQADRLFALYAIRTRGQESALLQNRDIESAHEDYDADGRPQLSFSFTRNGAKKWEEMTRANTGRSIAMIIDHFVVSAPHVDEPIEGGKSLISGVFTVDEVQILASQLNGGVFPAELTIVKEEISNEPTGQAPGKLLIVLITFVITAAATFLILHTLKNRN
jgi:SecD/SecF fusion protein